MTMTHWVMVGILGLSAILYGLSYAGLRLSGEMEKVEARESAGLLSVLFGLPMTFITFCVAYVQFVLFGAIN